MKIYKEQIALVKAELEQLDDNALISPWNECANGCDYIYVNDEYFFEENFTKPYDAICACCFGDYRYSDLYVRFDGDSNLESFDSVSDHVDFDYLASYVWEKRLGCIDWDEIEEAVEGEFRERMKENGVDSEVADRFMSEEFDWENNFTEMLEEAARYE